MRLLVGLGNPGPGHARQRHNVGFMALDAIAAAHGIAPFRARSKFSGEIAEGTIGNTRVLALKPTTFMNNSGQAVGAAMQFHKLEAQDVIVLHDELDLAPGKVRAKLGGGNAGHNGLRSIAAHIGSDFWRVRIGIGHPGDRDVVHRFVLSDFAKADADWVRPVLDAIADATPQLLAGDDSGFMTRVAHLAPPPKPATDPDGEAPDEGEN